MRRFLYITAVTAAIALSGCHDTPPAEYPETAALGHFVDDFSEAVQSGDADRVYGMLSTDVTRQWTKADFETYFEENRGIFEIYARRMQDDYAASAFSMIALRHGDPCGTLSLERSGGPWQVREVPDEKALATEIMHKNALIDALQSRAFLTLLNRYSASHPELGKAEQRALRRVLAYGRIKPEDVVFRGDRAVIDVDGTAEIQMICGKQGWRLDRCVSYH